MSNARFGTKSRKLLSWTMIVVYNDLKFDTTCLNRTESDRKVEDIPKAKDNITKLRLSYLKSLMIKGPYKLYVNCEVYQQKYTYLRVLISKVKFKI